MDILEEIRESFALIRPGKAMKIISLSDAMSAWVVRDHNWFGVAIEFPGKEIISERFSNVRLVSKSLAIDGLQKNMLLLISDREELRYEFASICAEFCETSEREVLRTDPLKWWMKWRDLIGNASRDKRVYSIIGEMLIFKELFKKNPDTVWSAIDYSTHDIISGKHSYEVKSTIKRYESIITVNSMFQLQNDNENLSIVLCRFEPTPVGHSVNSVVKELCDMGISKDSLEDALQSFGLEEGRKARNDTYKLLEAFEYIVDESFPRLPSEIFISGKLPPGIESINYEINLAYVENKNRFVIS